MRGYRKRISDIPRWIPWNSIGGKTDQVQNHCLVARFPFRRHQLRSRLNLYEHPAAQMILPLQRKTTAVFMNNTDWREGGESERGLLDKKAVRAISTTRL